ncbi:MULTISPECIES: acetyl-CoA C-acetyltransferase [Amycolatopsis]|uniref:Probable acetyl-CoA acetyltransferase n=1 Tax=Amycolatopsis tucumanensis TaxID=401106 RepID=A0ABP7HLF2_9PSEU|nr:acetyl-CoA C-acetyltransferase [Amycolatopsis tucumanensis]MCF6425366.1 acetyl-CoA C-acetyltransferase [Amycolatopsis tucumanensis]
MNHEVVICHPLRTPVGRYGGAFRTLSATELAAQTLRQLIERTGLPVDRVDDVRLGQCYPSGESPAIGRVAALDAGLPVTVPGAQIDRRCGSGLQAVIDATMSVATGAAEVVIAGGAESMSNVEFYTDEIRWGVKGDGPRLHDRLARARVTAGGKDHPVPGGMLETAENLRREYSISRREQDEWALRSHERAVKAAADGRFAEEILPVTVPGRRGAPATLVDTDEHPRPDVSLDALSTLRPVMVNSDPEATVTAGNASGQNDGAAACIVTTRDAAAELGLTPILRLVSWAVAGVPPRTMGLGPVPAVAKALDRAGLALSDIDLVEINEAFAAQVIACFREWDLTDRDLERVNVSGSGISLGHPVGATGARILATLAHEMRRRGARYGLETMCIGGGQGLAAVLELVE